MRKIGWLVVMFLCWASQARAQQTLTVVFEEWPPYQYTQDGKVIGIDTEVLEEAFRRMGVTPKFRSLPWTRALNEVKEGDADAIFSMGYPEQRPFLFFPKTPISDQRSVLFARKDSPVQVSDIHDLEGKSVGVVKSNIYGDLFDKNEKILRDESSSQEMEFDKLLAGRYDVLITFELVGLFFVKQKQLADQVKMLDYIVDTQPTYVGFSKAKGAQSEALANQLSDVLAQLRQEGFMETVRNKYLK